MKKLKLLIMTMILVIITTGCGVTDPSEVKAVKNAPLDHPYLVVWHEGVTIGDAFDIMVKGKNKHSDAKYIQTWEVNKDKKGRTVSVVGSVFRKIDSRDGVIITFPLDRGGNILYGYIKFDETGYKNPSPFRLDHGWKWFETEYKNQLEKVKRK